MPTQRMSSKNAKPTTAAATTPTTGAPTGTTAGDTSSKNSKIKAKK